MVAKFKVERLAVCKTAAWQQSPWSRREIVEWVFRLTVGWHTAISQVSAMDQSPLFGGRLLLEECTAPNDVRWGMHWPNRMIRTSRAVRRADPQNYFAKKNLHGVAFTSRTGTTSHETVTDGSRAVNVGPVRRWGAGSQNSAAHRAYDKCKIRAPS
jgi:hypothetical protein